MSSFIVTFTPYFRKSVIRELQNVDSELKIKESFSEGQFLVSSKVDKDEFLNSLEKSRHYFIKHISPAEYVGKLTNNFETDKNLLLYAVKKFGIDISPDERFAIQTRIISGGTEESPLDYKSKDVEVFIGSHFEDKGGVPVFSDKQITNEHDVKIISVFINKNKFYLGESYSNQNLNFNCDDYRVGSKNGGREISRAENKLKEALAKYNLQLKKGGVALDIGAAPGGWTKVLVDHGYSVVAVDPGALHPTLQNHPKVKHYKCRIEDLNFENHFDIIVNDMNIDPETTATIMNSLEKCLKSGGMAIVTLKLPNNPEKGIQEGIDKLKKNYDILSINSLFHNRQEVTALIQKKIMENDFNIHSEILKK